MKIRSALIGCALAMSLAACGGEPQPLLTEAQFLEASHGLSIFAAAPDSALVESAKAMCSDFTPSKGGDPEKPLDLIAGQGASKAKLAEWKRFLTYAVSAYCPQEAPYLPGSAA